ncbi:MAG: ADP-forming succinate--CoA ligase subunit beta [Candidatus Coatesbacteria bacterium]|nr:MAG: ADP-forming succinate--CoA ligase subunit beta [Candidatus Coatesbacteria bacterium]
MKIHEYQAKEILAKYGVPTPRGEVATTPEEAKVIAERLGGTVAIKAQVHVGGRGKAGGIKVAKNPDEAFEKASEILGMDIKGLTVEKVLVEEGAEIDREFYLGIVQDRATKAAALMVSAEGGVEIEEVARAKPEAIYKAWADPYHGLRGYVAYSLASRLTEDPKEARTMAAILRKLFTAFVEYDASLAEINPFVATSDGRMIALDAKINIDDNALYKHPDLAEGRDDVEETELRAKEAGLSFVPLDGSVACIVNGAGLAMTTMDLIKLYGAEPANFLDVGGSSNPEKITTAMDIITSYPGVKSVLVNIFGGITRCDDVANGLVAALKERPLDVPLVVRLTGTNEEEARAILEREGISAGSDMDEAVKAAVEAASN